MATGMLIAFSTYRGRAHHQSPPPDAVDLPAASPPGMPLTNPAGSTPRADGERSGRGLIAANRAASTAQLAAALTPATAQASPIPRPMCPITGPGARQMTGSRDRLHPDPGALRPMRRITAGISEAPDYTPIRRPPGDLPAADTSPAGRRTTSRPPRSRAPPRSRRSDQYGRPPACPRPTGRQPNQADIARCATAESPPSVTERQISGPADRSRHGERDRVMVNIVQRLRSGRSNWPGTI
jgi:hypothetical protein